MVAGGGGVDLEVFCGGYVATEVELREIAELGLEMVDEMWFRPAESHPQAGNTEAAEPVEDCKTVVRLFILI